MTERLRVVVASEDDHSYTDKLSGRRRAFTAKTGEAVVTFHEPPSEAVLSEVIQTTPVTISEGFNLGRGFVAVQATPDEDLASATDSLLERPEIANVLAVMVDDDGLTRYFLPDELTVQFGSDVSREQAEQIIAQRGSRVIVEQRTPGYYTLAVPAGRGLFETIREFVERSEVIFAEPSEASFNSALQYIPDDADFGRLWGLRNTGQTVNGTAGTAGSDIDAAAAWDLGPGIPDVIVAVIDTGADLDHPDLKANILQRGGEDWDFADVHDPTPSDADGHGTHVAGTAAAVDNTAGVVGVAPGCRIMPLRVNLTAGMNQNRADAINYVARRATANPDHRYVINCSWRTSGDHVGIRNAITGAVDSNVVVVFAAGNANQNIDVTPQFPAVYQQVIAVAATDQDDRRATFSNFGAAVDVSAPGVNIYSTFPDDNHAFLNGTSMAAPHVAGLAALIWSQNPALSNRQVRQAIETTCDDIDAANPGFAGLLGRGRINAFRATMRSLRGLHGTLLREESGRIYVLFGEARFHVPNMDVFNRLFAGRPVKSVRDGATDEIPAVPVDGVLLREESGKIVVVFGGARFHVPDMNVFNRLFSGRPVWQLWDGATDQVPTVPVDGTLLQEESGGLKYRIQNGKKIETAETSPNFQVVWKGALDHIPTA